MVLGNLAILKLILFSIFDEFPARSQGCQNFLVHDTKTGKIYPMNRKCTIWS
jgi:hypothetical protein